MNISSLKRGIRFMFETPRLFFDRIIMRLFKFLPDKLYLSIRYRLLMGEWIDWNSPSTFTEKIQWQKIYNRDHSYVKMVDKYAVKEYVGQIIGEDHVIPTLGVWNSVEDIVWDSLPDQFVLKTTHGGGSYGVLVCNDKSTLNYKQVGLRLKRALRQDIYKMYREWAYKNVPKRIIAEKYIQDPSMTELADYKFFCFNGEPRLCQVIRNRHSNESVDIYNTEWEHQSFVGLNPPLPNIDDPVFYNGESAIEKPESLDLMLDICRKLSKDIPFVRVDLYSVKNKVYFGELTFYPASGFGRFEPEEWNSILGKMLTLPGVPMN